MGRVLRVTCNHSGLQIGKFKRRLLNKNWTFSCGCNEPWKNHFWCPRQKWFMKTPCVFINKFECQLFENQCYGKTY